MPLSLCTQDLCSLLETSFTFSIPSTVAAIDGTIEFRSQMYTNMCVDFHSSLIVAPSIGSTLSPIIKPFKFLPVRVYLTRRDQLKYVAGPSSFRSIGGSSIFTDGGLVALSPIDILINCIKVARSAGPKFFMISSIGFLLASINLTCIQILNKNLLINSVIDECIFPRAVLGVNPIEGFNKVKAAYEKKRKEAEIKGYEAAAAQGSMLNYTCSSIRCMLRHSGTPTSVTDCNFINPWPSLATPNNNGSPSFTLMRFQRKLIFDMDMVDHTSFRAREISTLPVEIKLTGLLSSAFLLLHEDESSSSSLDCLRFSFRISKIE
ncbi:hypothetical protein SADUNF_Sadunf19G0001100 [Salix dunnii]|uniref:Uncharacterized protein n=1 Tax=Salix dunnii TaxID=1413687 RepID=A0A835J124_9ROSI|nr:hypothetical protein SADUNF_Sadunf19G0001100 [Salix dunnii]